MKQIKDLVAKLIASLNSKGVPVPLVRDPKTQRGDVALTLVFISSVYVQVGLIGKWSKQIEVDMSYAIQWFMICAGLYWARKLTVDGNAKTTNIDEAPKQDSEKQ